MKKIRLLNKISKKGTDLFDRDLYEVGEDVDSPDAIMVRSAAMHDMNFPPELQAIARAGAGVNNIPLDRCAEEGIVVFNTRGANANGVKELTVAALLLASRGIAEGVAWANGLNNPENGVAKAVEKGKSAFAGCELLGKTLGVIGLGAIGAMVAETAISLGMKVIGCDPFLSVEGAWRLSNKVKKAADYDEIFAASDYVTLHIPATPQTKGMLDSSAFAKMKRGVRIINLSRADLVVAQDLKKAISDGIVSKYVTDFPTEETVGQPGIVAIPHLGASTEESEDNCAAMAANELMDYLENGNVRNSVNYPSLFLPLNGKKRVCVLYKTGSPAFLSASEKIKAASVSSASREDYSYAIFECDSVSDETADALCGLDGVIRVFVK